jgi:signal transduction histidine kinase
MALGGGGALPAAAAGMLAALLGLVTIADGLAGRVLAWPASDPMSLAGGVCALGAGLAVILLAGGRLGAARALASGVLLLALVVLAKHLGGGDFTIGDILAHTERGTGSLGHMAPETAVGFGFVAFALFLARRRPAIVPLCVAPALCIAGASLGDQLSRWSSFMAPTSLWSALALVLLGGGAVAVGWRWAPPDRRMRDGAISSAAAVAVAIATILFARSLARYQVATLTTLTRLAVEEVEGEVVAALRSLAAKLRIVAAEPIETSVTWEREAELLGQLIPGLVAVEWVEPAGRVRHRTVLRGPLHDALEQAPPPAPVDVPGIGFVVSPVVRANGESLVRVIVPTAAGGSTVAVVALDPFLEQHLVLDRRYRIEITADDVPVYRHGYAPGGDSSVWRQERFLPALGEGTWRVAASPAPLIRSAVRTALPEIVLATGLLMSVLVGTIALLALGAMDRARVLRREVADRKQAQEELHRLTDGLENRVERATEELQEANAALRVENSLRRTTQLELEQSNRELQEFAGFVSHELKQPLASMTVWADVAASSGAGVLPDKTLGYLERLRAAIERMTRLIEGELALAGVRRGGMVRVSVDLGELVRDIVAEFAPILERKQARVQVEALPVVHGDPAQLRRVLANLIDNALKYRRPGVPPCIRVEGEVRPAGWGRGSECVIRVHDNGRGFDAEEREQIFDMFRRVGSPGGIKGSGIGLAMCRRIVMRHGGTISADGRPGEGATFTIVLSAPPGAVPAQA